MVRMLLGQPPPRLLVIPGLWGLTQSPWQGLPPPLQTCVVSQIAHAPRSPFQRAGTEVPLELLRPSDSWELLGPPLPAPAET